MVIIPPGLRVINKNIIYSDTVLNLKELGSNLNVTTISDISNSEFDKCLEIIFEDNKDACFNTIQYSRRDKKIYLYTDKKISTQKWDDRGKKLFSYQSYDKAILENIKEDLDVEDTHDENIISLYDIWKVYRRKYKKCDKEKNEIEEKIKDIIRVKFNDIRLLDISKHWKESGIDVTITDDDYSYKNSDTITFDRNENKDVYISEINRKGYIAIDKSELLLYIGSEIKKLMELNDKRCIWLAENGKYNIKSSSNIFKVDINGFMVSISIPSEKAYEPLIKLELHPYKKKVDIKCNSNDILSCIKDCEKEIFKKIFVNISDCPEVIQSDLHEYRKNYLIKLEEERIRKERESKTIRYKIKTFIKRVI